MGRGIFRNEELKIEIWEEGGMENIWGKEIAQRRQRR